MAFAVHNINHSYELLRVAREFVLAVPGETLANEAMLCGSVSGEDVDKVERCGFELLPSNRVAVPGIAAALANIELSTIGWHPVGDHAIVVGRVERYAVNETRKERPLLSVGPDDAGYEVLARRGIHRIGVIAPR